MDHKAIRCSADGRPGQQATGTEMVDPMTRQKVGASDIPEVILEQIQNFRRQVGQGLQGDPAAGRDHLQPVLAAHQGDRGPRSSASSRT
jgi:hypothetical protein